VVLEWNFSYSSDRSSAQVYNIISEHGLTFLGCTQHSRAWSIDSAWWVDRTRVRPISGHHNNKGRRVQLKFVIYVRWNDKKLPFNVLVWTRNWGPRVKQSFRSYSATFESCTTRKNKVLLVNYGSVIMFTYYILYHIYI